MRTHIALAGVAGLAASAAAQTNGSFETGDHGAWDTLGGEATVQSSTPGGLAAPFGELPSVQTPGALSQAEAESIMGLPAGTLADLYVGLGGTGSATAGDYNVMMQWAQAGAYLFAWAHEGGATRTTPRTSTTPSWLTRSGRSRSWPAA